MDGICRPCEQDICARFISMFAEERVQKRQVVGCTTGMFVGEGLRFLGAEEAGFGRRADGGLFLTGTLCSWRYSSSLWAASPATLRRRFDILPWVRRLYFSIAVEVSHCHSPCICSRCSALVLYVLEQVLHGYLRGSDAILLCFFLVVEVRWKSGRWEVCEKRKVLLLEAGRCKSLKLQFFVQCLRHSIAHIYACNIHAVLRR